MTGTTIGSAVWALPGPARFLDGIVRDLRDGHHVALLLPRYGPLDLDLDEALRRALTRDGERWLRVRIGDFGGSPLDAMFERFDPDGDPGLVRTAAALVAVSALRGRIVWLDGLADLDPVRRAEWVGFLNEYAEASRDVSSLDRATLIAPLTGAATEQPPTLTEHRWCGQVDRLDMLLFATARLRGRFEPTALVGRLAAASVARVALWDFPLAARLTDGTIEEMLEPHRLLAEVADERGWNRRPRTVSWISGSCDEVDGVAKTHSALLLGEDGGAELEHRLWSAEAEVLLPHIDAQRLNLIERLGDRLTVPWEIEVPRDGGLVRDQVEDRTKLEISHIYRQIDGNTTVEGRLHKAAFHLMLVRNELSHLKRVGPELYRAGGSVWDHFDVLR